MGFGVLGLGCEVSGMGLRAQALRSRVRRPKTPITLLGVRRLVNGAGFGNGRTFTPAREGRDVCDISREFSLWGFRFRVSGFGVRVSGSGCGVEG